MLKITSVTRVFSYITVLGVMILCIASSAQEFAVTVHGDNGKIPPAQVLSPNEYYMEYRRIMRGEKTPDREIYLKHPALPFEEHRGHGKSTDYSYRDYHPEVVGEGKGRYDYVPERHPMECDDMMMKDPNGKMTDGMKNMMCKMYKQWGDSMSQDMEWRPTQAQKNWWNSLTMKEETNRKYRSGDDNNGRPRRQIGVRDRARRKEYRMMNDDERGRFHHALNVLKNTYMDGESKYDMFVRYHQAREAPGAHFGPAFYGWHREMLFRPGDIDMRYVNRHYPISSSRMYNDLPNKMERPTNEIDDRFSFKRPFKTYG